MTSKFSLTNGALKIIMRGGKVDDPIMQVLGSKKIAPGGAAEKERYRLLLSDGRYMFSFAMVTSQNNDHIMCGEMPINSIIQLKRYITSVINNTNKGGEKRILVILDMELLQSGEEVEGRIGDPVQLEDQQEETVSSTSNKENKSSSNSYTNAANKPTLSGSASNSVNLNNTSLQEQLIHPISSLSPYQNKWVIKARVMSRSPVRTWSNSRGEGKLFSMDLIDHSGEIRLTAFKEAVDKYYDFIQVDKVYYFSKCQLKMANKQYSNLKNDYEMTIFNDTIIQECTDDTDAIPSTQFNFTSIDKVGQMEVGSLVDVIGVCKLASELQTFVAKSTGRELKKRELTLVDMSKTSISLTLWGQDAEIYDYTSPVIAIKGARVGEFGGGKNLSCPGSAIIKYNPDISEAFVIRGWYDNGGQHEEALNISARSGISGGSFEANWMSFKEVKDRGLGKADRGDYYQTKGTVLLMKSDNCFYKACPQENCNKKVVDLENGHFRCEKCGAEFPNFKYRLCGNMNVGDWSGNQWISMFTGEAEAILGRTAQEVGEAAERSEEEIGSIVNAINFKQFIFKCRAKIETYNDEARLKTVAVKVDKINYKQYNTFLLSQIQQLIG